LSFALAALPAAALFYWETLAAVSDDCFLFKLVEAPTPPFFELAGVLCFA